MAIFRILCPTVHDFSPKTLSSNTTVHRKRHIVGHRQTMQIPIRVSTVCLRFEKKNDVAFDENDLSKMVPLQMPKLNKPNIFISFQGVPSESAHDLMGLFCK